MVDYSGDKVRGAEETPRHIVSTTLAVSLPLALLALAFVWLLFD